MINKIINYNKRKLISFGLLPLRKNSHPVKWGIIGLGNMATKLSTVINGNRDSIVYAVASRSLKKAKAFASRTGRCKAYGSYNKMINDPSINLDIIYIATPVKYHYENIKQCLLAGKNVVCEKPITSNSTQLEELIEIAKANDCLLMEGMWMKCLPTFRKAIEWVAKGKIGDLELVKVDFYKRELIKPELTIYNSQEGGGVLQDYGVYALSFVATFFNGVPQVLHFSNRISSYGLDSDWHIFAKKNNVKAFVNISSNFSSLSKAALIGKKGTIEWDSQFNRTNKISLFDSKGNKIGEYSVKYKFEGFEYMVDEVNNCIRKKEKESQMVPIIETLNTLKVIDYLMAKKSMKEKY